MHRDLSGIKKWPDPFYSTTTNGGVTLISSIDFEQKQVYSYHQHSLYKSDRECSTLDFCTLLTKVTSYKIRVI